MRLGVLGDLCAWGPDGEPVAIGTPKERVLLATLTLRAGQVVPFDELASTVWGDLPPASAATTLRTYASHLRTALGPELRLTAEAGGYRLDLARDQVDAAVFESLAKRGMAELDRGDLEPAVRALGDALALWRGELLADLPPDSVDAAERVRLNELRLLVLSRWAEAQAALGRHAAIVPELERAVAVNPFHEGLWAHLLTALYWCGRQTDALARYEQLRTLLRVELGVEPSPELRRLHVALLQQSVPDGEDASTARPARPLAFVGRDRELQLLGAVVEGVARGRGAMTLLSGEPGAGKTRLIGETRRLADQVGVLPIVVRSDPSGTPLAPWLDAIESLMRRLPKDVLRRALGDEGADLVPLVPHLARAHPDLGQPVAVSPDQARRVRLHALVSLFSRVAVDRPLFIALDDLHWADDSTLGVLAALAEQVDEVPVVLVGAHRDAAADMSDSLARLRDLVIRHPAGALVELGPLSSTDVAAALRLQTGREPDAMLVRDLHVRSQGNPLFLTELLRHEDRGASSGPVPAAIAALARERCGALSDEGRRVIDAAAVARGEARWDVLAVAAGVDESTLVKAISEARGAGVLAEVDDGRRTHLGFSHELVRQAVLEDIPIRRRRELHRQVARALENEALDGRPLALDIAHHLSAASSLTEADHATRWLVRAADEALTAGDAAVAVEHIETALSLDVRDPALDGEIHHIHGWALAASGRLTDATAAWDEAFERWEAAGEQHRIGAACQHICRFLYVAGRRQFWGYRARGLEALDGRADVERAMLVTVGATAHFSAGRFDEGEATLAEAEAALDQLDEGDSIAHRSFLITRGERAYVRLELDVAARLYAAALTPPLPVDWVPSDSRASLAWLRVLQGRWDDADAELGRLEPVLVRLGALGAFARQLAAFAGPLRDALARGDDGALEARALEAHERVVAGRLPLLDVTWTLLGLAATRAGDHTGAQRCFDEAAASAPGGRPGLGRAGQILLAAAAGDATAVRDQWRTHGHLATATAATVPEWWYVLSAAEALAIAGWHDEAAALHPLVTRSLKGGCRLRGSDLYPVAAVAARTAAAAGDDRAAAHHRADALALAERLSLRGHVDRIRELCY